MTAAVVCEALVKRYPGVVAVDGLDLTVPAGSCLGLLGPNGAGKTTTVEMIEGLTTPTAGRITVNGDVWGKSGRVDRKIRSQLGIQLQETRFHDKLTVRETVILFRSFYRHGLDPAEAVAAVALESKATARVVKLSGGQRQRLALACALVGAPRILCLDEPTTGLDPQSRRQIWEVVEAFKRRGGTVLLTTHYMEEAERLADHVAVMDHGKIIAQDTPAGLILGLGADQIIEIEADRPLDVAGLRALEGVRDVEAASPHYRLIVESLARTMTALLPFVETAGASLAGLTTHRATLEDVFIHLTGRGLRDG